MGVPQSSLPTLSTIVNADLICVVDNARIVEIGDHEQLLAEKGLYHQLYEQQFIRTVN